jgi:methylmalonyl-CoA mutase
VPICDGHDSAINTINIELVHAAAEVIYMGFHRSATAIARAAVQEDVQALGISSYNGGHVEFFGEVAAMLRKLGANDIGLFGGGGGTITADDAKRMYKKGVDRIFFAGESLDDVVEYVMDHYPAPTPGPRLKGSNWNVKSDRELAKLLTAAENSTDADLSGGGNGAHKAKGRASGRIGAGVRSAAGSDASFAATHGTRGPIVVGVAGPGGAGKTTLIDELVLRFLQSDPKARVAVLSHDPSLVGNGALLGDRAMMIHAQDPRCFMRSLATRGQAGGLSSATQRCLSVLQRVEIEGHGRFDAIIVETVGIGQEAAPFEAGLDGLVDHKVLVMSPSYGSRLQLQKIAMLDAADIVVVNKSDLAGAKTASNEIEQRLSSNGRNQRLVPTIAKKHRDRGVDELFELLRG